MSAPIVTLQHLHDAPTGALAITADGFRYVKKPNGRWYFEYARDTPASWLLDPEHSAQPIRLLYTVESP